MNIIQTENRYELYKEKCCIGQACVKDGAVEQLEILPEWRRRGYGSYLLKELLRRGGGFDRGTATTFTAPLPAPDNAAGWALASKFGFLVQDGRLCRRRGSDLSAVSLCHEFLRGHCAAGGLYLDATCGNGHDTLFLCRLAGPEGRVVGMDIQPAAVEATNRRLAEAGYGTVGRAVLLDHADLLTVVAPGTADCVLFNFGWLPGADHSVHSTAEGSLRALDAARKALRPGGVLAAVLYSGQVIGDREKQAALAWFRALPLTEFTVLVCEFANWDATAPLPCFAIKRG